MCLTLAKERVDIVIARRTEKEILETIRQVEDKGERPFRERPIFGKKRKLRV
jgi:hypothetical protein